jgi:hypothetical protein
MCDVNSCNVFLLLFMALWVPISATLFRRAVPTLWHAFLFPGLRFFLYSSFCLVASTAFSYKKILYRLAVLSREHYWESRDWIRLLLLRIPTMGLAESTARF